MNPTEEQPDRLGEIVKQLFKDGQAYGYIYNCWQKSHFGDEFTGKAMINSYACRIISNAKGIHIQINGKPGRGKSDGIEKMMDLLPDECKFSGGISAKYLYGSKDTKDGTVIYIDEIVWSDDLGQSVKRITSKFQKADHRGTKDGVDSITQQAPKRLIFWVSSVDTQGDEQNRDRFILSSVDGSEEHKELIKAYMRKADAGNEEVLFSEEELTICKRIFKEINGLGLIKVVIPFAEQIRISGDTRAQNIFMDMIRTFAVYSHTNRDWNDDKTVLYSNMEDFEAAKELYIGIGGHDPDKYSETEKIILKAIMEIQKNHRSATLDNIKKVAKVSRTTVYNTIFGRKSDRGKSVGLVDKCQFLEISNSQPVRCYLSEEFNPDGRVEITIDKESLITWNNITTSAPAMGLA